MVVTKDKIQNLIDHMPESFQVDDLIEKIILLQQIEIARKEIEDGHGTDWEDVKKEMDTWFE